MTRQEFLQELDLALQGQMGQAAINENIRYYETYIVEEAGKGKTEQMVIDQLGNPRLIAKTLINTTNKYYRQSKDRYTESYGKDESDQGFDARSSKKERWIIRLGKRNTWYGKFFTIAAAILMIVVVANVVAFLLPILVPVILILLIGSLFFGSRR